MLTKTSAVIGIAEEVVDRASEANPGDRPFLEAAISSYLAAMAYAETEKQVSTILQNRFESVTENKIGSFLSNTYGKGQGRINKADIAELAKKFGDDCKSEFNVSIPDQETTKYFSLLDCRHKLAHGEPKMETLRTIQEGVKAAEKMLDALREAIA
jgi:DNA topoisomerase VI subunit B